jgi:hypothetical protein
MLDHLRPWLVLLLLAGFAVGCERSEPNPRAIDLKRDPRLKRAGDGIPAPKKDGDKPAPP